ncbi:carbohydrate binding family 9 domain-containing protein [bacterium]|nr:carbohydrate binding family 9 domain-containing protein [bacterium]RQV95249.1 MAG: hypothetical protein EH221_06295 [bacterium]
MKRYSILMCSGLCLFGFVTSQLIAQQVDRDTLEIDVPYRIPYVNGDIRVDGCLDESVWESAVRVDANIEVRPGENIPAPVRTEALLMYDKNNIYVGFNAYDPDPSKIQAHLCDRDNIWDDDWILILFDTFNDQRRTYDFTCNPLGIQGDMIETPTGGGDSWDAIWESAGRITDEGYVIEMVIPFRTMSFPRTEGDQIWGFDVVRSYPRDVRHHIGAFVRDRNNNCYMCQAIKLIGFAGATPGNNIEFDPTVTGIFSQEREEGISGPFVERQKKSDFGLTARWGFTNNLTLSTTVNPDFSNIEADVLQLDINNRFAIYYPEKRPFFLEGADFFSTQHSFVHTRTLADPDWGVKITGKEGPHGIGFFVVQDKLTNFLFPGAEGSRSGSMNQKSIGSAFRYQRDIFESSNIGVILTDREGKNYHNRVVGIDGNLKFTQKDQLEFTVGRTNTRYPEEIVNDYDQPESDFSANAWSVNYNHSTRNYMVYFFLAEIEPDFRADLAFMSQAGFRYSEIGGQYNIPHDPGHWFTWLSFFFSHDYRRDQFNNPLHKVYFASFNYNGPLRSYLYLYGQYGKDLYNGQKFRKNSLTGGFGLWPLSVLNVNLDFNYGDQIDYANTRNGTRLYLSPYMQVNLGLHLKVTANHTYEQLKVDGGRLYTANISHLRMVYQFSKRVFLRVILQYRDYQYNVGLYMNGEDMDPENKGLFSQILFSYKINPQTVFLLGYSDDYYGDHNTHLIQTNRTVFVKIGYAYIL